MNNVIEDVIKENGFNLHIVPCKKFKTINIVAKFIAPLSFDTITKRALLPYVLQQGTKLYPTRRLLQSKLDEMYGAVISIDGAKRGNNHIISVRLEVANQKYIFNESSLVDEAITILKEMIFQPNVEKDAFDSTVFNREKETLRHRMDAIVDDKMSYANMRLIDEMCKNERYHIHVHGYPDDLKSITPENLYAYYKRLLEEDQLDIYVMGDIDKEEIENKIKETIKRTKVNTKKIEEEITSKKENPNVIIEEQDLKQAKLHIGYRTNCTFKDDNYFALQVFNGIFGGFPSSKLFLNVREKNSLAYYAASRIESHKGLLLVFSGIAPADYKKAKEIMEVQMKAMKKGDFTDSDVEETKELIVNQLLETMDNSHGLIELLYQQVLGNKVITPEQLIMNIKKVTKENVVKVANKMEEDTVYLLTKKGANKSE